MAEVLPFERKKPRFPEPIEVMIGVDDAGLYADADGVEFRAASVNALLTLVSGHVLTRTKDWDRKRF